MKDFLKGPTTRDWLNFIGKTIFYFVILLILIYLYHYKSIQGGNFIYNEF
ncbi:teichoic acid D-Ala incorporation-associated protein DltX [Enterococcus pseudoavium]|uniref:Teichoic acid D-Ala incorporation-associated protein DltX n=1 Tax=Enterococcus pseudoavium TaxID=44007 RepID=A0AAE4HYE3_9ENTE|nr:teichoic acid D-Ala incorporation-associated protein DltX [Enterococcus pseudoavium]MDT2736270.1 teichoic acid D-Ala incorporation-associated protein DltX [Enterococcus pseudoavium]MDT2753417.1 teichoic acid D-Ala incorporation-associated protein DltX [Enterococcus pseudoavium]MDT2770636.1 teichoic acid D-Ala incorporation-associated protein DltX [Enterococcus pseudoavium]